MSHDRRKQEAALLVIAAARLAQCRWCRLGHPFNVDADGHRNHIVVIRGEMAQKPCLTPDLTDRLKEYDGITDEEAPSSK